MTTMYIIYTYDHLQYIVDVLYMIVYLYKNINIL